MGRTATVIVQVAVGAAGGAAVALATMFLLRRQVAAVVGGAGGRGAIAVGLFLRLVLVGGGLTGTLLWGLWCGVAFAVALAVVRQVVLWKAKVAP